MSYSWRAARNQLVTRQRRVCLAFIFAANSDKPTRNVDKLAARASQQKWRMFDLEICYYREKSPPSTEMFINFQSKRIKQATTKNRSMVWKFQLWCQVFITVFRVLKVMSKLNIIYIPSLYWTLLPVFKRMYMDRNKTKSDSMPSLYLNIFAVKQKPSRKKR